MATVPLRLGEDRIVDAAGQPRLSRERLTEMADQITRVAARARSEEDIRIGTEFVLAEAMAALGLDLDRPRYERSYSGQGVELRGRSDAVHGRVVIEYEAVRAFKKAAGVRHAADQLDQYLRSEAAGDERQLRRGIGVGIDGEQLFFLRYLPGGARPVSVLRGPSQSTLFDLEQTQLPESGGYKPYVFGPYPVTADSLEELLINLRALNRRRLDAEGLAQVFGPGGAVASQVVRELYASVGRSGNARSRVLFEEWRRHFGLVYGSDLREAETDARSVAQEYGLDASADFQRLLYSIHTYYALLMKLLAVELAALNSEFAVTSVTSEIAAMPTQTFRARLLDVENGGLFARMGVRNFLEGDLFSWYLDEWDAGLADAVRALVRALNEFEPATGSLGVGEARDILKSLYQYLVPKRLRHDLGEYYTPDWLAERVLDEVGYTGDPASRLLDPACGSGTFLVLAMQRALLAGADAGLTRAKLASGILHNIQGFDLNPLAVIAARTNYLMMLGGLARELPSLEIPIYLCDSVLSPNSSDFGQQSMLEDYEISTAAGSFLVPRAVVEGGVLSPFASLLEDCVRSDYSTAEFLLRAQRELSLVTDEGQGLRGLFERLKDLHREGRDGIWARLIKNAFAPVFAGRFDYVVGNPPWVNWESLPQNYRDASAPLWERYGLASAQGQLQKMRQGKKDLSMLMLYAAADHYVAQGGRLALLITQSVVKTTGAGSGFRRFQLGSGPHLRVLKVHDLSALQPFEGASTRTALIVLDKGARTQYPVPYYAWAVDKKTQAQRRTKLEAEPVNASDPTSPWITLPAGSVASLRAVIGKSAYRGYLGANTGGANGIYWLNVMQRLANGLLVVENMHDAGKKIVERIRATIEPDLVYPLVRGRDVGRFRAAPSAHVLLPQSTIKEREGIDEAWLKVNLPLTYAFLKRFEAQVSARRDRKYYPDGAPFYTMRNVASYTFADHKVVWPEVGTTVEAGWLTTIDDVLVGRKPAVPAHTVVLVPTSSEAESAYLAGMLNSSLARTVVRGYIVLHPSPHVLENVAVPRYDAGDGRHRAVMEASSAIADTIAGGTAGASLRISDRQLDIAAAEVWDVPMQVLRNVWRVTDPLGAVRGALPAGKHTVEEDRARARREERQPA